MSDNPERDASMYYMYGAVHPTREQMLEIERDILPSEYEQRVRDEWLGVERTDRSEYVSAWWVYETDDVEFERADDCE